MLVGMIFLIQKVKELHLLGMGIEEFILILKVKNSYATAIDRVPGPS